MVSPGTAASKACFTKLLKSASRLSCVAMRIEHALLDTVLHSFQLKTKSAHRGKLIDELMGDVGTPQDSQGSGLLSALQ